MSTANSVMSNVSKSPQKKQGKLLALNKVAKPEKAMPPPKVHVPGMPPYPDCGHGGHKLDLYQELADQFK